METSLFILVFKSLHNEAPPYRVDSAGIAGGTERFGKWLKLF